MSLKVKKIATKMVNDAGDVYSFNILANDLEESDDPFYVEPDPGDDPFSGGDDPGNDEPFEPGDNQGNNDDPFVPGE